MLKINKELCIGCGICEDQCAFAAIEVEEGIAVIGDSCTLCGACIDVCEPEALSMHLEDAIAKVDIDSWSGVMVYCEFRRGGLAEVSLELLGAGRNLSDQLGVSLSAVLIGHETSDIAEKLLGYGADTVFRVDQPEYAQFAEDRYGKVMTRLIRDHKPEIVLAGATAIGRSFIPGVATSLNAGLTADCTDLQIGDYTSKKDKHTYKGR